MLSTATTLCLFQSTLPVRGATYSRNAKRTGPRNFNPRSPCGERLPAMTATRAAIMISIHAPRAGSDIDLAVNVVRHQISIHAPRAGSDPVMEYGVRPPY